jgi:hypothetical protein
MTEMMLELFSLWKALTNRKPSNLSNCLMVQSWSPLDTAYRCISLPSRDTSTWNEFNCEDAFKVLAQTSSIESYPEMTFSLAWIELTFEEFTDWLEKQGYAKPKFWKPSATKKLVSAKRGRPPEYNWIGVKKRLADYARDNGPVKTFDELMQKCSDFAVDLHLDRKTPDDKTIREAIETHRLDTAAGNPGKEPR